MCICSRRNMLRVLQRAILVCLHDWINLRGCLLAENQVLQDTLDRIKLCGIDKWVGADVEK